MRPNPGVLPVLATSAGVIAWMGWHWWPDWGLAFAVEDAPLAWWQAALLVANASLCAALACVHAAIDGRAETARWWALLGLGVLFAALDDRFMAHEAVQDLLQFELGVPHRWAQGVILAYGAGGLGLLRLAWKRGGVALRRWAAAAVCTGFAALALDLAFDSIGMQIVEELCEALAETLLLAGLLSELGNVASRSR